MALEVGYNIKKAEELQETIANAFGEFKGYMEEEWEPVKTSLRNEWIGEDEQDFEKKFIERLCKLYENAHALAQNAVNNIEGLKQSWIDFQKRNKLENSDNGAGSVESTGVEGHKIPKDDVAITFSEITFDDSTDRGLASPNSAGTIQEKVGDFVEHIKSRTNSLFDAIEVDSAFFGEQTGAIENYILKCGDAIAEITVAVKDLNDTVTKLAGENYTASSTTVSETFNSSAEKLDSEVGEIIGESRWS